MAVSLESLQDTTKGQKRKILASVVMVSVIIHIVGGLGAAVFIVARYLAPPEATFVARKMVTIPPKIIDPKMAAAEFEAAAPKPVLDQKIASLRATDFALPDIPMMPMDQVVEFTPSVNVSATVTGMLGGLGGGGGGGGGQGGGGEGDGMSFFGITDTAKRVLILVDTSDSMFERTRNNQLYRFDFSTVKNEAIQLIESVGISTYFNVIIYEGGAMAFSDQLLPATQQNKSDSKEWILNLSEDPQASIGRRSGKGPKLMEGGGTRLDTAFKMAFKMDPEVIFIVTDGEINRGNFDTITEDEILELVESFQDQRTEEARIHVIHYLTSIVRAEEENTLKALARKNDGEYEQVEAIELEGP